MKVDVDFGTVHYKDNDYAFSYDEKYITLTPSEINTDWFSIFKDAKKKSVEEEIYGVTKNNNPIVFLKLNLVNIGGGVLKSFVPAYIVSNVNAVSPLPEIANFKSMKFYGECINNLYNPRFIIDEIETDKPKHFVSFKSSKEVQKIIEINNDEFLFGVQNYFLYSDRRHPIELKSYLKISFKQEKTINDIVDYYQNVRLLFSFINNRAYISFSEIILTSDLYVRYEDEKEPKNLGADFKLFVALPPDKKIDLPSHLYQIKFDDIEKNIDKLFLTLKDEDGYNLHYPDNQYEENHIDIDKFLRFSSAFECWFDLNFKDYKSDTDELYKRLKDDLLDHINERGKSTNSTGRDYLKRFKQEIERQEGTLLEQLKYSYNLFEKCLIKVKNRIYKDYELGNKKISDIFLDFSKKRNKLSHGNVSDLEFSKEEIVGAVLTERLIQCLIYYKAGFKIEDIVNIVDK